MVNTAGSWTILIVDDEQVIHDVLTMNLRHMEYNNKPITFLNAYSASQAKEMITDNPNIAVVILDVMMEEDDAGLNMVKFIREDMQNANMRILLHTGQPGIAPKREAAERFKIDGYLDKNVTDNDDCYVSVKLALRAYEEHLKLKDSAAKDDISLMGDLSAHYIDLLAGSDSKDDQKSMLKKVNKMVHLVQQMLGDYALNDLKNDLSLGSTKAKKLSLSDYRALIRIHDIKVILSHTPSDHFYSERSVNFDMLVQAAKLFSKIKILPEVCRQDLQKHIQDLQ
jgi:CheY-like chemotaxis protein